MSEKPTPLKVFGRTHYACTRCKSSKIKCSGERPACSNCKMVNKNDYCVYPSRDRKIVIMESDLTKLHARADHLEDLLKSQNIHAGSQIFPNSEGMVQERGHMHHVNQDAFLLPDTENEIVPHRLLVLCAHLLPNRAYASQLISLVRQTYSTEFYIVDADALDPLCHKIYEYFEAFKAANDSSFATPPSFTPVCLCFFFAMLAFGEQMLNATFEHLPPSITANIATSKVPGIDFYSAASKLFHLSYEETNIRFIQSSILLGLFSCNLNRYNTVYNYFGVAVRSAVANGYHRLLDRPSNLDNMESQRHRVFEEKTKRLWWTIFVLDTCWSARMNMPVHIEYTDTDVTLPNESPVVDLHDNFDIEILECNVHLAKCVSSIVKRIYGPNVRTFSMNYINTEEFNRKNLIRNIGKCAEDIYCHFEKATLNPLKTKNIFEFTNRNIANLFMRYNQLVITASDPLFSLIFSDSAASEFEDDRIVLQTVSRSIAAALRTISMTFKFYENNRLFVLGYWDSQHLFTALATLTLASIAGFKWTDHNKTVALLRFMALKGNINAKNHMAKLETVQAFLNDVPEINLNLDLCANINDYIIPTSQQPEPYNPFIEQEKNFPDITEHLSKRNPELPLYEQLGFSDFSEATQKKLWTMAKQIQAWHNYKGLPIHILGTGRVPPVCK